TTAKFFPCTSRVEYQIGTSLSTRGSTLNQSAIGNSILALWGKHPFFSIVFSHLPPAIVRMPVTAARAVLRQSHRLFHRSAFRHASSTSEAGSMAKDTTSSATSKASQGLSRVASSAGPVVTVAVQNVGNALRRIGGRT